MAVITVRTTALLEISADDQVALLLAGLPVSLAAKAPLASLVIPGGPGRRLPHRR